MQKGKILVNSLSFAYPALKFCGKKKQAKKLWEETREKGMEEGKERNSEKERQKQTKIDNEDESHLLRLHFLHLKINMFFTL